MSWGVNFSNCPWHFFFGFRTSKTPFPKNPDKGGVQSKASATSQYIILRFSREVLYALIPGNWIFLVAGCLFNISFEILTPV